MATKDKLVNLEDLKAVYDHGTELLEEKADQTGFYPDLIAGTADNLLSSSYKTDKTPYIIRRTPYGAREKGNIVGGSIVWNQLFVAQARASVNGVAISKVDNNTIRIYGTATGSVWQQMNATERPTVGHKYFVDKGSDSNLYAFTNDNKRIAVGVNSRYTIGNPTTDQYLYINVGNGTTIDIEVKPMFIDLTLMFGPTIADYIYTQEQATAGAGVALAKAWAGIVNDYYPYDAGSIKSVTGLTAHRMTGKNLLETTATGKTQAGVTWTMNDDGSITASGTATGYTDLRVGDVNVSKINGKVTLSGNVSAANNVVFSNIYLLDANDATIATVYSGGPQNNHVIDLSQYGNVEKIRVNIKRANNTATSGTYYFQVECGETATAWEQYQEPIVYPLDSSLTLRGVPKLDGDSIYYDGDIYKADGTVERRYGVRAYQSGDESDANVLTDGTNTVYKLTTPTTEQAEPYTALQTCDPAGTEEWVGASMPVGHDTKYYADLKGKIEDIPDAPSTDGTYTLRVTVSNGVATYSWE